MKENFSLFTIVVWNGVIAKYGNIKDYVLEGDLVVRANDDEIKLYDEKNLEP